MNHAESKHPIVTVRAALRTTIVAMSLALAAAPADAGDWKFTATPYVWAADLGMKASLDGRTVVDEQVPVSELISQIDLVFQGRLDLQYRTLGLATDLFDVSISDEANGVTLPNGAGTGDFEPAMRMSIFDLAATWSPRMQRRSVTGMAGMRLVYERADVDANFHLTAGPTVAQSYSTHETLVDGLVGVRYVQPLSPRWGVQTQFDASTGGTEYTWSTAPSVFYVFDAARRYTLTAGYRHMHIAFKESDGLESDMTLSGALVGFRLAY